MKHLLTITLIVILYSTTFSQADKRPSDPQELGELVFKSFQNENYDMFLRYIFTEADCDTMAKNSAVTDSLKTTIVTQMKGLTNHIRQTSKNNFEEIISKGKQQGIKWHKVKLNDVNYEITNRDNIQSADIFLLCKYKDISFIIKLDNCHKSDAWLMMDNAEILFK